MWIAPEYRGRGIAKRMMDIAFQWARNNQFRAIVVKVARNNARALRLYREYGFAPAMRPLSNNPDDHVVLIKCLLNPLVLRVELVHAARKGG
jgi:ribosomal protein S18 acetylase RimI-like enzyme